MYNENKITQKVGVLVQQHERWLVSALMSNIPRFLCQHSSLLFILCPVLCVYMGTTTCATKKYGNIAQENTFISILEFIYKDCKVKI